MSTISSEVAPRTALLSRPAPILLILASFFLLTIPLCVLQGGDRTWPFHWSLGSVYVCVLGTTHFLISFAVYLQSDNLRYFNRDWANRAVYFLLPTLLFVSFDLYHALNLATVWPVFDVVFLSVIRLADFHHFTRQTYGVLRLFRVRSGSRFAGWLTTAESCFFHSLTLLLLATYLTEGRFQANRIAGPALLALVLVLGIVVLAGYARAWHAAPSGSRAGLATALGYLLLQTGAASLAVFRSSLYAFSLATHYVEYHVLMAPRCFAVPLDQRHWVDRIWARIRSHKVVFYSGLVLLAVPVTRYAWMGMWQVFQEGEAMGPLSYRMLTATFDGLFVTHYLIESRIWKFHDPFFRKLRSLYLGPAPAPVPVPARTGPVAGFTAAPHEPVSSSLVSGS